MATATPPTTRFKVDTDRLAHEMDMRAITLADLYGTGQTSRSTLWKARNPLTPGVSAAAIRGIERAVANFPTSLVARPIEKIEQ
jgi:hypothetical protein